LEAEKPVYRAFFVTPDNHISKASILQAETDCPASAPVRQIQGFEERRISGSS
jgi:hypothetical protein